MGVNEAHATSICRSRITPVTMLDQTSDSIKRLKADEGDI